MEIVKLFIDDVRSAPDESWAVVRSSRTAIDFMKMVGCPDVVSFDHDLGGDDTALKIVKWMVEQDLDSGGYFFPDDFEFIVHSANPVGAANIRGYLNSYFSQKSKY